MEITGYGETFMPSGVTVGVEVCIGMYQNYIELKHTVIVHIRSS